MTMEDYEVREFKPTKRNPKGAGRKPSGLPPRKRSVLYIERDAEFNANLIKLCELTGHDQTNAVKMAVKFFILEYKK